MSTVQEKDPDDRDVYSDVKPVFSQQEIIDRDPGWGDVLPFLLMTYFTLIQMVIFYFTNSLWFTPWVGYALIPVADYFCGHDTANLSERVEPTWAKDKRFLIPLYSFLIADMAMYFGGLYLVSIGWFVTWKEYLVFTLSMVMVVGANMSNAHELQHRPETIHKVASTISYQKMLYSHFYMEHLFGHHMNVATLNDAATSRKGEWLYTFVPRCIYGSFASAWKIENSWYHRRGRSAFHWTNRMILFTLSYPLTLLTCYLLLGWSAFCFHCIYSAGAIFFLETINYIRHYGLMRQKDERGVYEKVDHTHSWNAPQRVSNWLFFKLQRHSDHHYMSHRPYQILRSLEGAPVLPHGYTLCLLIALFPPVWFAVMDPYVEAFEKREELKPHVKRKTEILSVSIMFMLATIFTVTMIFF